MYRFVSKGDCESPLHGVFEHNNRPRSHFIPHTASLEDECSQISDVSLQLFYITLSHF